MGGHEHVNEGKLSPEWSVDARVSSNRELESRTCARRRRPRIEEYLDVYDLLEEGLELPRSFTLSSWVIDWALEHERRA